MVRTRIPSTKSHTDDTVFATAIKEVVDGTLSLRAAADTFAIPKSTLARAVTKYRNAVKTVGNGEAATNISYQPNWNNRQVFTGEQESLLKEYLIEAANISYVKSQPVLFIELPEFDATLLQYKTTDCKCDQSWFCRS